MDLRFDIDDVVYRATFETEASTIECEHCAGTARIRVIFGDGQEVSIPCENCSRGYLDATGRIEVFIRTPKAERCRIKGFEFRDGKVRWQTTGNYIVDDESLFKFEAIALAAAKVIAKKADADEEARISMKEKDHRSWAWHASYHRKCIREAERQIEHHKRKLSAANLKAKS